VFLTGCWQPETREIAFTVTATTAKGTGPKVGNRQLPESGGNHDDGSQGDEAVVTGSKETTTSGSEDIDCAGSVFSNIFKEDNRQVCHWQVYHSSSDCSYYHCSKIWHRPNRGA
jgi:hypothetical protein